jgi:ribosomal protein S18 acetylase RimI-like enzyme
MTAKNDLPTDIAWRPMQFDDLPQVHHLMLSSAGPEDIVDSLADLQTTFDDPWSNPETDSLVGCTADGVLVAFARSFLAPELEREAAVWLWHEVAPGFRSPELEDALLEWLEARGRERLANAPAGLTRSLRTGCDETRTHELTLYERRSYARVRYFCRMRRNLHEPIPAAPPAEVTIVPYSPNLDAAMHTVFDASFADHWGFEPITRREWEQFYVGSEGFRPDLSLLALAGAEPAGMLLAMVDEADNQRTGRREGRIRDVGVLRSWRRRGVATALVCEAMRRFRAAGLDTASLGVDTENPTGALGLYERLGFEPVRRFVTFEKAP